PRSVLQFIQPLAHFARGHLGLPGPRLQRLDGKPHRRGACAQSAFAGERCGGLRGVDEQPETAESKNDGRGGAAQSRLREWVIFWNRQYFVERGAGVWG